MVKGQAVRAVHLTDTHLYGVSGRRLKGVDTRKTLEDVVSLIIEREEADLVLLTGDVSQDESPKSYRDAAEVLLRIGAPVYFLPGNHDVVGVMYEVLDGLRPPVRSENSFVRGDWLFVMLDSTVEGHVEGRLGEVELARLERELGRHPDKNAMVCLHHNPFSIGSGAFNEFGLTNGDDFFAVVDKHACVRVVLTGHVHQEFNAVRNGVRLMTTPSTCVQFKPGSPEFAVDRKAPGYRSFTLHDDGTVETEIHRLSELPEGLELTVDSSNKL